MPVVASTPGATALTGRTPPNCSGRWRMRWRVRNSPRRHSGPRASGVTASFPSPATSTPCPGCRAQQPPQLRRQRLGGRADVPRQRRQLQRDIAPGRLAERGLAPAVENVHVRHGKAVPLALPARTPASFVVFPGALLPERLCLHGKVRPDPHFSDILSL